MFSALGGMVDSGLGAVDSGALGMLGDQDPQMAPPGQFTMDPYRMISMVPNVTIKEKVSAVEVASAALGQEVEMANKYKIMSGDRQVMFAIEGTGLCARQCQNGLCCYFPAWDVQLRTVNPMGVAEMAFFLKREWSCTCCCFGRPDVVVGDIRSGRDIARITDPCTVCNLVFNVRDQNEEERLQIGANCCQLGLCCPLPCGPCSTVEFTITDSKSGSQVGQMTKSVPSILAFLAAPDVDNYHIDFQYIQDPEMRIALIAAVIFIDFRLFNNNSNDDSRRDAMDQFSGDE